MNQNCVSLEDPPVKFGRIGSSPTVRIRVGLDLLHVRPEIGGGWNYISSLLQALASTDPEYTYVAYCTSLSRPIVPSHPSFVICQVRDIFGSQATRVLFQNTLLQWLSLRDKLSCMHYFCGYRPLIAIKPSVVSIYDMGAFGAASSSRSIVKSQYVRAMLAQTMRHADVLLPMSQTTLGEMTARFRGAGTKSVVIPPVIPETFSVKSSEQVESFRYSYDLPRHFWLYVAHYYPHKNHRTLLRAYRSLVDHEPATWPLVLRGRGVEEELQTLVGSLQLADRVKFLPSLSEDQMAMLYNCATALVFPSLYEGGGLPVLEAMACGCPVLAARIPAVLEFGADAVKTFDPRQSDSMIQAMREVQATKDYRACVARGLKRAGEFSGESLARRLATSYLVAAKLAVH